MSFVEDARKLLQDFVAPEVRSINIRLDALSAAIERRFVDSERLSAERQAALLDKIEAMLREISLEIELAFSKRRIKELESGLEQGSSLGQPVEFGAASAERREAQGI